MDSEKRMRALIEELRAELGGRAFKVAPDEVPGLDAGFVRENFEAVMKALARMCEEDRLRACHAVIPGYAGTAGEGLESVSMADQFLRVLAALEQQWSMPEGVKADTRRLLAERLADEAGLKTAPRTPEEEGLRVLQRRLQVSY